MKGGRISRPLIWRKGVRSAPDFDNTLRILHWFCQLLRWSKIKEKLSPKVSSFSSSSDSLKAENTTVGKAKCLISEKTLFLIYLSRGSELQGVLAQPGCVDHHETQSASCLEGERWMKTNSGPNASWKTKASPTCLWKATEVLILTVGPLFWLLNFNVCCISFFGYTDFEFSRLLSMQFSVRSPAAAVTECFWNPATTARRWVFRKREAQKATEFHWNQGR